MNRSREELAMRDAVEAWGRARWPGARVVHELVTGSNRIDVAFIQEDHLAGVEIKSSRDVLDRLGKQIEAFQRHIPEVWIAVAPKWVDHIVGAAFSVGRLVALPEGVYTDWQKDGGQIAMYPHPARRVASLTVPMLDLLWRAELHAIAARCGLTSPRGKPTCAALIDLLARGLTGDEIVMQVCRELRARNAFWKADPPVRLPGLSAPEMASHLDLFRKQSA